MRIHIIQHVSYEGLGCISDYLSHATISWTKLHEPQAQLPRLDTFDALIILGGSMGIHDHIEYPWLKEEKEFLISAIAYKKPILGICLGAQLLAHCLGANVTPNSHREIGWFPVSFSNKF